MSFADQIAIDLASVMNDTSGPAETIVYTTSAGIAASIQAIVFAADSTHDFVSEGEYVVHRKTAAIELTDIANPSVLDSVTIGGVIWKIERVDGIGFGKATLNLVRDEPRAKQAEMFRKKL